MNYLLFAFATSLMLLAVACENGKKNEAQDLALQESQFENAPVQYVADTALLPAGRQSIKDEKNKEPGIPANTNADWDKKIIKTGVLNIEVDNYEKYNVTIHQQLKKWEAYIGSEQENSSDYKIENSMIIKIPVQYFDEAVQQLSTQSGKLLVKQINAQDVTGEFLDTKARMEAKKRIRMRYLEMVQKAKNMEEVLQVEREINAIQEQIEAGEGRINYLGHAATYSTIQLSFFQVLNAAAIDENKPGFGKRLLLAMNDGFSWMSDLFIVIVTVWPLWLGALITVWLIRKKMTVRKLNSTQRN